ncbi:MAG: septum site-determining protein MinC [Betaproteobacteria bacterium]|nr:septum site-determining protein MinC [Betaproteobacteria bacterium]
MSLSSPSAAHAYEIKSADLPLVAFQLKTGDVQAVAQALALQLAETPDFFNQDATLLDLDGLPEGTAPDFPALIRVLQSHGLQAVAIKTHDLDCLNQAKIAGLAQADDARIRRQAPTVNAPVPVQSKPVPAALSLSSALVLDKPLRSGQQIYAKDRDLVVLAMVNPGAEVIADGHIHVYAPLRGKAIAGARGFSDARIFAQSMDPELISIAGVYRTSENPLPHDVRGRAAQVALVSTAQGDKLVITPLQA